MGKKSLHDARKTAKMNEAGKITDLHDHYKNFVFISWVLNKGTEFLKKRKFTGSYILEYKKKIRKINPDSVQKPCPWDIQLNQDGLD